MALAIREWILGDPAIDGDLQLMKIRDEALSARAADINTQLEAEELQPGRKRKRQVEYWLKSVEELQLDIQCFEEEIKQKTFSRKMLKRQILSFTKEMDDLMKEGNFPGGITLYDHASSSVPLVTTVLKGSMFETNLRQILTWLTDDSVSQVGIYGLGGVGKTTLAMHVHNKLLSSNVYWVTVSQETGIFNLQNKIAKTAKLDFLLEEEDETKRAALLSATLKQRKNVIIFLDDMWQQFSLQKVGIPVGEGECKLIITTRSLDVCKRMECQLMVKVEPLSKEESWEIFSEKVGNLDDLSLETIGVAKLIVKKCAGLPLAILAIGGSMRGVDDIHEWNTVLEEVSNSARRHDDMESHVFPLLNLSYARLNDVKLQKCFLNCALYPEDSKLGRNELIQLWISDGLFEEIDSREKQLNKGHTVLNRLINASLLEAMDNRGNVVKMHDLIRDLAISIGRDSYHFLIRAGQQLTKIPDEREWTKELNKVSLISNYISQIPSNFLPECPYLLTLLFEDNPLKSIPDSFFSHLKGLRFLSISGARIENLPDCISDLENLSALEVRSCRNLTHLPSLEKLINLRELNLGFNTSLKEVTLGKNGLPNLRFLCLLGCDKLCVPFHELISGLPKVECLELGYGVTNILAKDLIRVENLTRVRECWISSASDYTGYIKSKHYHQLRGYQFYVGPREIVLSQIDHFFDTSVVINMYSRNKVGGHEALILPNTVQLLQLIRSDFSIKTLSDAIPSLDGLTSLSRIWIGYCVGLEHIWPSISSSIIELKSLKELNLVDLTELRGITEGQTSPIVTFHNLKKLTVEYCSKIQHLFMPKVLSQLQNLEFLEIQVCAQLEVIVAESDDAEAESSELPTTTDFCNDVILLRNLRTLRLIHLPNLVTICSNGLLSSDHIEEMVIVYCPNLIKKIPLSLPLLENGKPSAPCFLRKLIVDKKWWESLESDHKLLLQPFVDFEDGTTPTA